MPIKPDAPRVPSFEECIELDKEFLDRPLVPHTPAEEPTPISEEYIATQSETEPQTGE